MSTDQRLDLSTLEQGSVLREMTKEIVQENVALYAEASKDFNPIHIDEEFARNTPLGGTIAHGMLILAYVSQMMISNFGQDWLVGGKLNARFKAPARPGDTITVSGTVRKIENDEGRTFIKCDILCQNQAGETVIAGNGTLTVNT
ncbi:MAG: MaoC family dehydratase [Chloroflexi bacterium]|jgi:3-hydroxybutyryl-CoA dehydratase|nr:MaoC family dehydratase [Chloroflexota bacterium]